MSSTDHSLLSSYREALLEHLFAGEIMRHAWLSGLRRMEVLKPQVDGGGYDLVLESKSVVRHVQLKATFRTSTVRRFTIHTGLSRKPSGCVICMHFDQETLELGPFFWLGGAPGEQLPDLSRFPVARHTKGDSKGVKNPRPNLRVVPRSAFERVDDVALLAAKLFGPLR